MAFRASPATDALARLRSSSRRLFFAITMRGDISDGTNCGTKSKRDPVPVRNVSWFLRPSSFMPHASLLIGGGHF